MNKPTFENIDYAIGILEDKIKYLQHDIAANITIHRYAEQTYAEWLTSNIESLEAALKILTDYSK